MATLVMTLAGCGGVESLPGLVPVAGTVKYDGKPLPKGLIAFLPDDPKESTANSPITNGSYRLMTTASSPGLKPGTYKVIVQSWEVEPGEDASGKPTPGKSAIPAEYADSNKTPLRANIDKAGNRSLDLNLEPGESAPAAKAKAK